MGKKDDPPRGEDPPRERTDLVYLEEKRMREHGF